MRIGQIDVPESLLEAQRNGTLVVFAGAGVSMPTPSGYPGFEELAQQIAAGSALAPAEDEPSDRFLGRLQNAGTRVHEIAHRILSDPASKPNPLHGDLLRLFDAESGVRLVTTNFDSHFTTAAREALEDEVAVFNAPALPLGHRFDGIVYLHGSIEQDANELVLTDGDFGRAYLTEGWTRRFLQKMFERYTVLFVGYSHRDVVTSYLARGLPPETQGQRFALTDESDPSRWNLLGVSPIVYPLMDAANRHEALGQSVRRWVDVARMGALDHEQKIKEMVRLPPPLEPEDADYIEDALKEPSKARFFARHADDPEWLRWADGQPAFDRLFEAQPGDEVSGILARWFAQTFACEHPDEALRIVSRRGSRLPPRLWDEIAFDIARKLDGDAPPDARTVARWVAVLLGTPYPNASSGSLEYLLEGCRRPDDVHTAVLLFEYLTGPRAALRRGYAFEGESVRQEVELTGEWHSLRESWNFVLLLNLDKFAERLESVLTANLHRAHFLLRAAGEANEVWDPLSASRSAIEPHEQDFHDTGFDLLVDAARDTLEWMLEHGPENAARTIEAWVSQDVPMLKRLAVHGVGQSSSLSADDKLEWVLQQDLLYAPALRHEVFRLLEDVYPQASERSQDAVLDRALGGPQGDEKEGIRTYEIYNLLFWLYRAAPNSTRTTERFEEMQSAHGHEFEPSEHPDLLSYSYRLAPSRSPISVEELLSKDVGDEIDWLLAYGGEVGERTTRGRLLETVSAAVARSCPFGRELSRELRDREIWDTDLWAGEDRDLLQAFVQVHESTPRADED